MLPSPQAPKKRGRPPKAKAEEPLIPQVPKKRGRPSKVELRAREIEAKTATPLDTKKLKPQKIRERTERIAGLRMHKRGPSSTNNPDRPLTEKQKLFTKLWAQGESIPTAAYRAGYFDNTSICYHMAKDPAILKLYNAEKVLYEAAAQMTRKKVMDGFLQAAEIAVAQGESIALTTAYREIAKMCGYFEPTKRTVEININDNSTMKRLSSTSTEDLLKLVQSDPNIIDGAIREVSDVLDDTGDADDADDADDANAA